MPAQSSARKVLLIGWDAADWKLIHPLIKQGKMPVLQQFLDTAVSGNIATLQPILSPMLWTSIATGKHASKHGIHGFTEPDPHGSGIRPISSLGRKSKALWNILHQNGLRSNVVGWWPSHPAEPINGTMVSNHFVKPTGPIDKPWKTTPGAVHPAELTEKLASLRLHPSELGPEHILPFIPKAAKIDQKNDRRLDSLAKILAETVSTHALATALMQLERWDFMAVYYDSIDHFGHGFMKYHPPRRPWIPEEDFELYQGVMEAAYRFHDAMLAALLTLAGPETTVILMSDHGFHPDHLRPRRIPQEPAGPAAEHRQFGILAMRGPDLRQGAPIHSASLLDITPTVLTLFGLPVGRDMDGKPLLEAFSTPPEVALIDSWESVPGDAGTHPPHTQSDPEAQKEALQQLVALGYIEKPPEDASEAVRRSVRELRYNLARSLMDAQRHHEAMEIYRELWRDDREEVRFGLRLLECLQECGWVEEAEKTLQEVLKAQGERRQTAKKAWDELQKKHAPKEPKEWPEKDRQQAQQLQGRMRPNPLARKLLLANQAQVAGDYETAVRHYREAASSEDSTPGVRLRLGQAELLRKDPDAAEAAFAEALSLDPELAAARIGLARAHLARRRNLEAAAEALTAVELVHFSPVGHYLLGCALHRIGRVKQAVEALRLALSQNANFPDAHRRLARLYERLNQPEKSQEHKELAKQLSQQSRHRKRRKLPPKSHAVPTDTTLPSAKTAAPLSPGVPTVAGKPLAQGPVDLAKTLVIVSGLPRSGTSMMMQMLEAGGLPPVTDGERGADESNPRGYLEDDRVKLLPKENTWILKEEGRALKVVAPILSALPELTAVRVIFMDRSLEEVVNSQEAMRERLEGKSSALPTARLRGHFARVVTSAHMLMHQRGWPILVVPHRTCVEDPARVSRWVNSFLGGKLDETSMAAIVDPTLYRSREDSTQAG